MIFSSLEFLLVFLPAFLITYYAMPGRFRPGILLAGSLLFYGYGEPVYVLLLAGLIVIGYFSGRLLEKTGSGLLLGALAAAGASLLIFFKLPFTGIRLPLGISFYVFQLLAYLIDIYRGEIRAERSFLYFAAYISMFPRLTAGPLVGYRKIREDIKRSKVSMRRLDAGLKYFAAGLAMKTLLADRLGLLWTELATIGYSSITTPMAWLGALSYSLQLYFDFYGYSLMAIGLGKMLGLALPANFRRPYAAVSVRDFYRRWHMTLSGWFTKYVYIPLGGSRHGMLRTVCSLLIVWLLTSLWHGCSLNFFLWGMSLCGFILLEKLLVEYLRKRGKNGSGFPRILRHLYVLAVIPVTWICFAVTDLRDLQIYLGRMFALTPAAGAGCGRFLEMCANYGTTLAAAVLLCVPGVEKRLFKWRNRWAGMIALTILFWLSIWYIRTMGNNPFMYFRF